MKKLFCMVLVELAVLLTQTSGCAFYEASGTAHDTQITVNIASDLAKNQPTPADISYSLERYNLIRRAYWVNGQREKANTLVCEIEKPLGYIVLLTESGSVVGNFIVDGKVSSLNSYLTPGTKYPSFDSSTNTWIADVDGSYGENDNGIFFFTPDGKYIEWTGTYLYTDIPMIVSEPVLKFEVETNDTVDAADTSEDPLTDTPDNEKTTEE